MVMSRNDSLLDAQERQNPLARDRVGDKNSRVVWLSSVSDLRNLDGLSRTTWVTCTGID